jgi:hypothetical protein
VPIEYSEQIEVIASGAKQSPENIALVEEKMRNGKRGTKLELASLFPLVSSEQPPHCAFLPVLEEKPNENHQNLRKDYR